MLSIDAQACVEMRSGSVGAPPEAKAVGLKLRSPLKGLTDDLPWAPRYLPPPISGMGTVAVRPGLKPWAKLTKPTEATVLIVKGVSRVDFRDA